MTNSMKEGIYFNLPEDDYHAADALSNSSMKLLHVSSLEYWDQHINPDKPERRETGALDYGTALHCRILEPERFEAEFARKIDKDDYPDALDTMDDLRDYCVKMGISPSNTKPKTIERIREAMGSASPQFLSEIIDEYYAGNEAKKFIPADLYDQIQKTAEVAYNDIYFAELFREGHSEVSIFVEFKGVMLKCRIDRLTMRASLDLKSFSRQRNKPFKQVILDALYYEEYWIQAWVYRFIRELARQKLEQGLIDVHGAPDGWVEDFVNAKNHTFGLAFIESSRPYHMAIWALDKVIPMFKEVNLYWQIAARRVNDMINLYIECKEKYGDNEWREPARPETLSDLDIPQIMYR